MFGAKIRLSKELFKKAEKCAKAAGYSSVDEFAIHTLEKEIARLEEAEFEGNAAKKLKGLGYIS